MNIKSLAPEELPEMELQDLLSFNRGAQVVSPENEIDLALIDHKKTMEEVDPRGMFLLSLKENKLPYEVVFSF